MRRPVPIAVIVLAAVLGAALGFGYGTADAEQPDNENPFAATIALKGHPGSPPGAVCTPAAYGPVTFNILTNAWEGALVAAPVNHEITDHLGNVLGVYRIPVWRCDPTDASLGGFASVQGATFATTDRCSHLYRGPVPYSLADNFYGTFRCDQLDRTGDALIHGAYAIVNGYQAALYAGCARAWVNGSVNAHADGVSADVIATHGDEAVCALLGREAASAYP